MTGVHSVPAWWLNILIRREFSQTGRQTAPDETDLTRPIRESFARSEPPPSASWQLATDDSNPLDTCSRAHTLRRAWSEEVLRRCSFSATTGVADRVHARPRRSVVHHGCIVALLSSSSKSLYLKLSLPHLTYCRFHHISHLGLCSLAADAIMVSKGICQHPRQQSDPR